MHVRSRHRALAALACLLAAAFAAFPLGAAAQASPGTVLFWRPMSGSINGVIRTTGSALFSIGDDGSRERQLTPYAEGVFYMPGVAAYDDLWMVNAFSPSGHFSLVLEAHTALPHFANTPYQGKYYIMNARGDRTEPLFPGADDLQKPSEGPGYGSVTWGPAGTQLIAYTNVPDIQPHKHDAPPCIHLKHPDGTDDHPLWCTSGDYRSIEGLRWSGDGKSLLAYAVPSGQNPDSIAQLYLIDIATGAATLIDSSVEEPYAGWGVGDLSFDGHMVVYGEVHNTGEPSACNVPVDQDAGVVWCARNMLTGQAVALADPDGVVSLGFQPQALISPDGAEVYLGGTTNLGAQNPEVEVYALKTDGTGLRKVTSPCVALDDATSLWWRPVRLSPDGKRMLANCHTEHFPPAPVVRTNKIMIVNLADGSARFVTRGRAYDWHVPSL